MIKITDIRILVPGDSPWQPFKKEFKTKEELEDYRWNIYLGRTILNDLPHPICKVDAHSSVLFRGEI